MSRTWRKIPKKSQRQGARRHHKGGATASAGPSPERQRPDTDYDVEAVHLAAELLEQVSEQLNRAGNDPTETGLSTMTSPITQSLWDLAAESVIGPDQIIPVVQVAELALKQVADEHAKAPGTTFAQAAAFLRTMVSSETNGPTDPSKTVMVPDGRQRDTAIPFWRDHRATGLREADHRRARREARTGLANPESSETVRTGKGRRYTDKYGDYYY